MLLASRGFELNFQERGSNRQLTVLLVGLIGDITFGPESRRVSLKEIGHYHHARHSHPRNDSIRWVSRRFEMVGCRTNLRLCAYG